MGKVLDSRIVEHCEVKSLIVQPNTKDAGNYSTKIIVQYALQDAQGQVLKEVHEMHTLLSQSTKAGLADILSAIRQSLPDVVKSARQHYTGNIE